MGASAIGTVRDICIRENRKAGILNGSDFAAVPLYIWQWPERLLVVTMVRWHYWPLVDRRQ